MKAGRLRDSIVPDPDGGKKPKINSELADLEWMKNSDQSKMRGEVAAAAIAAQNSETEKKSRAGGFALPLGENPHLHAEPPVLDYQKARGRREHAMAQLAELELAVKEGSLCKVADVEKEWLNAAAIARTKVMGIASRARQAIPELTPAGAVILEGLIYEALSDLASAGEQKEMEKAEAVNAV
ncbi:MAG: hypothetical protein WC130_05160 [Kiritimatiellia bacterium]